MADINPAKHGWLTSEFALTVAMHVITALTLSGVVARDNKWAMFASLLASALSQMSYNASRGDVKAAMIDAGMATEPAPELKPAPTPVAHPVAPKPPTVAEQLLKQGERTEQALQQLANVLSERLPAKEPPHVEQPK